MRIRPGAFGIAVMLWLLSGGIASAQDFQTGVTYLCNGERLLVESCNIRDLSDNATCMVQHPDRPLHNGFMAYTNETRGSLKKLIPTCKQPSPQEIARVQAFQKKQQDTQDAIRQKNIAAMDAPPATPTAGPAKPTQLQADQRDLRRCISSGRVPAVCMGNTLSKPFDDMIGKMLPSIGAPLPPGLQLAGNFEGNGSWRLEFDDRSAMMTCAGLDPEQHSYSLVVKNNRAVITIQSTPKPIVLTVSTDGMELVGPPGPIVVDGVIYKGEHDEINTFGPPTHVTEYANRTRTCDQPILSSKGAGPSALNAAQSMATSLFNGGDAGPQTPPGLRMHGTYSGQGGFSVEFYPESAVVGCGSEAARAYPYVVQASGTQTTVKIEDPAHPLVLAFKPDGQLDAGAGPYEVHGRTITGQNDDGDFTFAPLNATCNLGVLAPGKLPPASAAAAAPAPAATAKPAGPAVATPNAPTGNAVLTVVSGFPVQPGAANPLAGRPYLLLRDSVATVLAKGGIQFPPGMSPQKAVGNACANRTPDCQKSLVAISADSACGVRADANGKATLPGVPPGTYYLMVSDNNQLHYWDLKVELKAGANSVTLDQRNAAPAN